MVLDACRIDHLFANAGERADHVGTHLGAMQTFFASRKNMEVFNRMLGQVAVWLESTPGLPDDVPDLTVGFVCTWGKHRSRLLAWLLHQATHSLCDVI